MAKSFGNSRLLWINRSGIFYAINGQQSHSKTQAGSTIDIGDKNTAPYELTAPTSLAVSISGEIWPDLPDVNGFEWLFALSLSQAQERIQIRRGGLAGNGTSDVLFDAFMYILQCDENAPRNGVVGYSYRLGLAATPTVNRPLQ